MISACTRFARSFEAPEAFSSRNSITSLLPNTPSKPNLSKVYGYELSFSQRNLCLLRKVHFQYPLSGLECPLFLHSKSTYMKISVVKLIFSFKSKFRRNASRYSVVSWIPFCRFVSFTFSSKTFSASILSVPYAPQNLFADFSDSSRNG